MTFRFLRLHIDFQVSCLSNLVIDRIFLDFVLLLLFSSLCRFNRRLLIADFPQLVQYELFHSNVRLQNKIMHLGPRRCRPLSLIFLSLLILIRYEFFSVASETVRFVEVVELFYIYFRCWVHHTDLLHQVESHIFFS